MSRSELPKPLGPDREWRGVRTIAHGAGFALYGKDDMPLCSLWNLRRTSGQWQVWVTVKNEKSPWGSDRIVIDLGPHDSPPFELAEAMADATR